MRKIYCNKTYLSKILFVSFLIFFISCSDSETNINLGAKVAGSYQVNYIESNGNSNSVFNPDWKIAVIRKSNFKIDINQILLTSALVPNITIKDAGNGKTTLNYSDASGNMAGSFQDGKIEYTITSGTNVVRIRGQK